MPGRYDGAVVLLWPREQKPTTARGPCAGWDEICRATRLISVPGEHHSSVSRHAHLVEIGAQIREVLARADTQNPQLAHS